MYAVILFSSLLQLAFCTTIVLVPSGSSDFISELEIYEGTPLIISCQSKGNFGWTFNGGSVLEILDRKDDSRLFTASFDPTIHAGHYECFEENSDKSASVRVYSKRRHLPTGFKHCGKVDHLLCGKGHCAIDHHGNQMCICSHGWHGKHCDMAVFSLKKKSVLPIRH